MYSSGRHGAGGLGCCSSGERCRPVESVFPPLLRLLTPQRYKNHMPRAIKMAAIRAPMAIPADAPAERPDVELVLELVLDPVVDGTPLLALTLDVYISSLFISFDFQPSTWLFCSWWTRTEGEIGIANAHILWPGSYVVT